MKKPNKHIIEGVRRIVYFLCRRKITQSLSYEETIHRMKKQTNKQKPVEKDIIKMDGCWAVNFKNYYFSGFVMFVLST